MEHIHKLAQRESLLCGREPVQCVQCQVVACVDRPHSQDTGWALRVAALRVAGLCARDIHSFECVHVSPNVGEARRQRCHASCLPRSIYLYGPPAFVDVALGPCVG